MFSRFAHVLSETGTMLSLVAMGYAVYAQFEADH